mmetsp:Transcript_3836/g.5967  ORF Transcript_3836/g.5967 Transcript_3836/m.5967 type:complete len:193 (+) Transcript_3836:79-657(+)|eukprot:CAMPEP_0185025276 /NCGR_PEP_ID=MMETSP1103-20130426/8294_1 /TAXON_ID=36769 /ORGANISM="Paraphysomonas bandaiensis, Strain Caron Lab Isolate" /LENGTH=192 /DNA_ID=CAMNT_0027558433 /DNA_START=79 /DNA_END=657 /DNA_ORIENTATION=-
MDDKKTPYPSSIQEKIETARDLKNRGNEFFKAGKFSKARSEYGKALAFITGFPGSSRSQTQWLAMASQMVDQGAKATDEEEADATELEKLLRQNIATCYIKTNMFDKAISHCDKALAIDSNSWKAKLRKGEAQMLLKNLDAAKALFEDALSCTSEVSHVNAIKREMKKLNQLYKAQKEEEKKIYMGMFERGN